MEEIKQENTVESGISLKSILVLLWRNIIFIVLLTVVVAVAGGFYASTIKPTYTATRHVLVKAANSNSSSSASDYNDITVATVELPTVADFFKKEVVVNGANDSYGKEHFGSISSGAISTSYNEEKRFLTISYTDANKEVAKTKIDAVIQAGKTVIESTNEDGTPTYFSVYVEILPVDAGKASVSENSNKNTVIILSVVLGAVLSIGIVLLKNLLDDTIKSKEDLEKITGIKMLACIDDIKNETTRGAKK